MSNIGLAQFEAMLEAAMTGVRTKLEALRLEVASLKKADAVAAVEEASSTKEGGLLTYGDLARHWGVCPRQAKRICRQKRLLPVPNLGHKTVRFRPADLARADERGGNAPVKPRVLRSAERRAA